MPTKIEERAIAPILSSDTDPEVLVQYDPDRRPKDEFVKSKFIAFHRTETDEHERIVVRPGVQKMLLSEWQKWESNPSGLVKAAKLHGVLRKVSDKTDLAAIAQDDPYLAQEILRFTNDLVLLSRWVEKYDEMSPVLREAMDLKDAAIASGPAARRKFVLGRQVA